MPRRSVFNSHRSDQGGQARGLQGVAKRYVPWAEEREQRILAFNTSSTRPLSIAPRSGPPQRAMLPLRTLSMSPWPDVTAQAPRRCGYGPRHLRQTQA